MSERRGTSRPTGHPRYCLLPVPVLAVLILLVLAWAAQSPAPGQRPENLIRLPGVVALAESQHRDRWGLDGWHPHLAIDGGRDGRGDGARTTAWASDNWEYTHSLAVVFPRRVQAMRVLVHWAAPSGTPLTPRRFVVESYLAGTWRRLGASTSSGEETTSDVAFAATPLEALRVSQPPDGAHPGADRRLWIAEVEVEGTTLEGAPPVDIAGLTQQVQRELARRRQAEADARVAPALAVAMRVRKAEGFTGIVNREDLARGRRNVRRHAWARRVADSAVRQASWWLDKSDEYIRGLIPGENPRATCPSFEKGCPIHGGARQSFTASMDAPYRWRCIAGGEEWYDGAVVSNPGTGEAVVVRDDGSGWLAPPGFLNPGRRYYFTAAYRYFLLGKLFGSPYEPDRGGGYPGYTAILPLAQAYAFTGDARFAHKAGVMLNRLAEVYRFMDGCVEGPSQRQDGYIGQTFERFWVQTIAYACDLVWDAVSKDTALLAFFRAHGGADYDGDGKATLADIPYNLQRNLLGYIYEYVHRLMPYLDGDFIIYELGALACVTATLRNGEMVRELLDGDLGLRMLLANEFFRDGKFIYDSTGYNVGNALSVASLAEWLYGFQDDVVCRKPLDPYNDPRYRMGELFTFCRHVDCDGRVPQIGDTGGSRSISLRTSPPYSTYDERALLRLTRERPFYAAQILAASGGNLDALRSGAADDWLVFHARDELTPKAARGAVPAAPQPTSHLFPDSGIAILRAGPTPETRWHVPLTFSKGSYGHGHTDKLSINVLASGYDLSADLGYPTTWTDAKYGGWETHTASHWTVMLDQSGQQGNTTGKLRFYDTSPWLDSVEASCEAAYPGSRIYRRTVAIVRDQPGGKPLYIADLFRTDGARTRDYLHHSLGRPEDMTLSLPGPHGEWEVQARGTLAGEDVPFGTRAGYGFLKNVRKLRYDGPFTAEWRVAGASQPDRYLWTRRSFGDCDIELTVTRTGRASGPQERAVLVFHVDPANPGNRRQVWIDVAGGLPVGKPARLHAEVRGARATVWRDGQVLGTRAESIGAPPSRGRVGFLHYYNYAFRYDDLVITPMPGGGPTLRESFSAPLSRQVWERVDPTYRVVDGQLEASDSELAALRMLVPGGVGPEAEVITALGEGYGVRGRSPWESHVILRDRRSDPKAVSVFASVLEVHTGRPRVRSVARLPVVPPIEGAVALRIEARGRTDYLLSAMQPEAAFTAMDGTRRIAFQGRFGWLGTTGGRPMAARLVGGGHLRCESLRLGAPPDLHGTLVATDVERSRVRVRFAGGRRPSQGQLMLVHGPGFICPSVYPVSEVAPQPDGSCWVSLGGMPLSVGRGRVASVDRHAGAFSSATPLLKLRVNPGLFDGRRVRPAETNRAPQYRLRTATESAFVLADPAGLRAFRPGSTYVVYDVGPGDRVEVVSGTSRTSPRGTSVPRGTHLPSE